MRADSLKSTLLPIACAAIAAMATTALAVDAPAIPAFPGAEGYGAATPGGRGGQVYLVTNLNDSGPGSLREGVEAKGPRIVVFRVSGNIELKKSISIRNPYITIAGQTAPGDGICLKGYPLGISTNDVIVRYLRVRYGDISGDAGDAISSRGTKNIILDHVSASWSVDEAVSIYHCENVTVQWCLISESLFGSVHPKGPHGFGGIWGSNYSTYHHNLLAHHSSRNPRFASGCGYTDYRNNVVYNWGYNSAYGGEKQQRGSETLNFTTVNMVANYYKPGPATIPGEVAHRIVNPAVGGKWYVADNVVFGNAAVTTDNWAGGVQPRGGSDQLTALKLDKPWDSMPIKRQTAEEAYQSVLKHAGASLPKRDSIDTRIIEETRTGTATYEGATYKTKCKVADPSQKCGIIDSQKDVGGWPELRSAPAPIDIDSDGMPDEWEVKYGLAPKDPTDNALDKDGDGYTNIEEYLNGTDPTVFIGYTEPENNVNTLH